MRLAYISVLLVLASLGSCVGEKPETKDAPAKQEQTSQQEVEDQQDDCVRGKPSAILASGSAFVSRSPREAFETVSDAEVPRVVIRHYGCAHYGLDFTFTWAASTSLNRQTALREAADRISSLRGNHETAPTLQRIRDGIRKLADDPTKQTISLGEMETIGVSAPAPNAITVTYDVAL